MRIKIEVILIFILMKCTAFGAIYPPYFNSLTSDEALNDFFQYDLTYNGNTWVYSNSGGWGEGACICINKFGNSTDAFGQSFTRISSELELKDALQLTAGQQYRVSCDLNTHYAGVLTFYFRKNRSPDSQSIKIDPIITKISNTRSICDGYIIPPEDGEYYLELYLSYSLYHSKDWVTPYIEHVCIKNLRLSGAITYSNPFDNTHDIDGLSIVDSNEDDATWYQTPDGITVSSTSEGYGMDDWLILTPVYLEAGKRYNFSCDTKANSQSVGIEVMYGDRASVTGLTRKIINKTSVENTEYQSIDAIFIPNKTGNQYIGIHGFTNAADLQLFVKNIEICCLESLNFQRIEFEDGISFAKEYGDWTFVDVDAVPVGGFQNLDIPGITPGTSKASFFVFDNSGDEFNQTFDAHSGTFCLAALFRYDNGTTDDWAISPRLSGEEQEISFWARSYSNNFPEKIEFFYSMDNTDIANFVQVDSTVYPVPSDWTNYTFTVPIGAKYFAVRSCATESFMLMLDDFTFIPSKAVLDIPFSHPMTRKDDFMVINANGDNNFWSFGRTGAVISNNPTVSMDDWIISPPLKLEANKTYKFSCKVSSKDNESEEKIEVRYGFTPTASGIAFSLIPQTVIIEENFVELEGYITPEGNDPIYIGLHGMSDSGQGNLIVKDFSLELRKPKAPTNIVITEIENTGFIAVKWDPVTVFEDGAPINDPVHYNISKETETGLSVISENLIDTSYSFQAVEEGQQDIIEYIISAEVDGSQNSAISEKVFVGYPYNGIYESFSNGEFHYAWVSDVGFLSIPSYADFSVDRDYGILQMSRNGNHTASLISGKISLEGMSNPALSFYTLDIDEADYNEIQLYVKEVGSDKWTELGAPYVIHNISSGEWERKRIIISLKSYLNKIIQLRFQVTYNSYSSIFLDQIIVGDNIIPNPITFDINRINRYIAVSNLSNEEASIYWTEGEGTPDKLWGEDGDFYTGTYEGVTGTFLRMTGTQTIRLMAKAEGMTDSEIKTVDFSEDMISVEEPEITFSDDKLTIERDLSTWCVLAAVHDIDFNGDRTNPAKWNLDTKYAVFPPNTIATYNLKVDDNSLWKEDDTYLSLRNMQCDTVKGKLPVHVLTFRTRPGQNIDISTINPATLQDIADDVTANVREYGKAPVPQLEIKHITLQDVTDNIPEGTSIVLSTIAMATDGSGQVLSENTETLDAGFIKNLEEYNYKFHAMAVTPNCISSLPSDTVFFTAADHKLQTPILKFDGKKLYAQTDPNAPSTSLFRIKKDVLSDETIEEQIPNSSVLNGFGYKDGLTFGKYAALSHDAENRYFSSRKSDPIEIHSIYHREDETTHYLILDGLEPLDNLFNIPGMPKAKELKGTLVIMDSISKGHMDYLADSIANITKLNLESVEWPDNTYPGYRIPQSVRTIRFISSLSNIRKLPESPHLMEVEWTSTESISSRDVTLDDNNHILRVPENYKGSLRYSSSWGHVVKGLDSNNLEMDSITFFDSKAFYNSEPFKAQKAVYARKFAKGTPSPYDPNPDKCAGWETIILPFAVDTVVSGKQGFTPFGVGDNKAPHFWLYEASEEGWKPATEIKADIPYLISFPLNKEYLPESMHDSVSDILFIGNDVHITATAKTEEMVFGLPAGVSFAGNFLLDSDNTMLALNETELEGKPAGSIFCDSESVLSFRAGIKGSSRRMMPVFGDWGQSGMQTLPDTPKNGMTVDAEGQRIVVRSLVDCTVEVFDLTGALVERLKVHAGEPTYTRTLAPGIYIAAGRKLLIR